MIAAVPIWCDGWIAEGERLAGIASDFEHEGDHTTAGDIYRRASVLISYAEWSMLHGDRKRETFDRGRELTLKAIRLSGARFEDVQIPYGDHTLEAMFWPAGDGPRPTAVCFNGLHSSMEWFWQVGLIEQLTRRGGRGAEGRALGDVVWATLRGFVLAQMLVSDPLDFVDERAALVDLLVLHLEQQGD